jgi:hypothetical protein
MRLDWNEISARAALFARDWDGKGREKKDNQTFYEDFFNVFGVPRRRVASFEHGVQLGDKKRGYLDLFWKGKLLVEQKTLGRSLKPAKKQALEYFGGLRDDELPRYLLLSDFQNFELYDLDINPNVPITLSLAELPGRVQDFGFIVGQEKRVFRDQDPVNVRASEMMGALHDALEESGYVGHDLEQFLVRLLFCLFADDTGIFQPLGAFEDFVKHRTREDGGDIGALLSQLFQVLNTPEDKRQRTLDADLANLPYVNGDLFARQLPQPAFDRDMRDKLINVCGFNWEKVSPAIFGSLFQSVLNKAERRKKGAHYTSERNILKVIEPLFLDDLRAEFSRLKGRRDTGRERALNAFHDKLGAKTFFDPACGCGNFLVIAYRELRLLEIEVLKELYDGAQRVTDVGLLAKVNVDQFYGIEIAEFPACIAEVAMWMMDHIMNRQLSAEFGQSYLRIPLKASPNILHADALEADWSKLLAPVRCSYILGNPPFIGQSYQAPAQREQMRKMLGAANQRAGSLDYVCAWFLKAGAYVKTAETSAPPRIGFVATNSITQGEQVAQLWPLLFERYQLEIAFAHRTFQWLSDARGAANVHCVIIGLTRRDDEPKEKRLFSYDAISGDAVESKHGALTAYLIAASGISRYLLVAEARNPLVDVRTMRMGSKIVDGGHLIFDEAEYAQFLCTEPEAKTYFRPLIGSREYINGQKRFILALDGADPSKIKRMPQVRQRLARVRKFRQDSKKPATQALADYPARFEVMTIPTRPFLAVPEVSSERRDYVPLGWLSPPTIPSNKILVVENADLFMLGALISRMHMAWMRHVGGRLKSDYQYSSGIVYNTFPWPQADDKARAKVSALAQAVLDARALYPDCTLADLYDPDSMPPDLRKAHHALDLAVDKLYRAPPFANDRERVEHLFGLYEKLTANLLSAPKGKRKRGSRE